MKLANLRLLVSFLLLVRQRYDRSESLLATPRTPFPDRKNRRSLTAIAVRSAVILVGLLSVNCSDSQRRYSESGSMIWTFDDVGQQYSAADWRTDATNPTAALATWLVITDPTAPSGTHVFALTTSDNYDGTFNLAIVDEPQLCDLELSVKVKAVAGEEDQGGGPIWRCQDGNNYYICRFNPLESNFRVYVVSNGKRRQLESVKVDLNVDRWYDVRVRMVGNRITCYLNGNRLLDVSDDTISHAGRVGLWTKADAITSFDDLYVCQLSD
jgi:hypothetical protein